jgi:hypothetical protein
LRDDIKQTLARFDASAFACASSAEGQIANSFEVKRIRVLLRRQPPRREQVAGDKRGHDLAAATTGCDWEQACRQRWRSLANGVKAKLALIDDDISTIERIYLADIVVPSTGQTYRELAVPAITEVYARQALPPLMPRSDHGPKVIELPERSARWATQDTTRAWAPFLHCAESRSRAGMGIVRREGHASSHRHLFVCLGPGRGRRRGRRPGRRRAGGGRDRRTGGLRHAHSVARGLARLDAVHHR